MAAEIPSVKPDILITVSEAAEKLYLNAEENVEQLFMSLCLSVRSPPTGLTSTRSERRGRLGSVTPSMTS